MTATGMYTGSPPAEPPAPDHKSQDEADLDESTELTLQRVSLFREEVVDGINPYR
jgi:hypothetical protein